MPKLKPWEERAPAAAGATPPQRTHESHSPRPQHLTGGGGGGAAAASAARRGEQAPPPLLAAQTDAGAGAAAGRERGDTSHISPLFNGERAAERPTAAAAHERRTQAATGGGAANPPRRARSLLRPDRAAICASGGKRADKAQRRGGRASECRAPRAHRDVWRGRQRRRSHNERRSGGIAPHRRERHSPSVPPMSTSSCRKPPKGLRTDTISHLLPRRGLRGIPQCSARTFP